MCTCVGCGYVYFLMYINVCYICVLFNLALGPLLGLVRT